MFLMFIHTDEVVHAIKQTTKLSIPNVVIKNSLICYSANLYQFAIIFPFYNLHGTISLHVLQLFIWVCLTVVLKTKPITISHADLDDNISSLFWEGILVKLLKSE